MPAFINGPQYCFLLTKLPEPSYPFRLFLTTFRIDMLCTIYHFCINGADMSRAFSCSTAPVNSAFFGTIFHIRALGFVSAGKTCHCHLARIRSFFFGTSILFFLFFPSLIIRNEGLRNAPSDLPLSSLSIPFFLSESTRQFGGLLINIISETSLQFFFFQHRFSLLQSSKLLSEPLFISGAFLNDCPALMNILSTISTLPHLHYPALGYVLFETLKPYPKPESPSRF